MYRTYRSDHGNFIPTDIEKKEEYIYPKEVPAEQKTENNNPLSNILGGMFSNLETDDIIIIALIVILLFENSDDNMLLIILLAILFIK